MRKPLSILAIAVLLSAYGQSGIDIPFLAGSVAVVNCGSFPFPPPNPTYTIILHSDVGAISTNGVSPPLLYDNTMSWLNEPYQNCDWFCVTNGNNANGYNHPSTPILGGPRYINTNGPNGQPFFRFLGKSPTQEEWWTADADRTKYLNDWRSTVHIVLQLRRGLTDNVQSQPILSDINAEFNFLCLYDQVTHLKVRSGLTDYNLGNWATNWLLFTVAISTNQIEVRSNTVVLVQNTNPNMDGPPEWLNIGNFGAATVAPSQIEVAAIEIYNSYDAGTVTITNRENTLRTKYGLP